MYHVDHVIGEGSFGKVFLTREDTAIKSFRRLQPEMSKISCIREYDTFIKLVGCKNIVSLKNILFRNPFKDFETTGEEDIFFVMEKCWETGDSYVTRNLTFEAKVKYALDVALGLEFMHSRGIQHNDLKSDNILVFKEGDNFVAKLTDFGFSKIYSIQDYCNPSLYIKKLRAPEIREFRNYSYSHDVWAYTLLMLNLFYEQTVTTDSFYSMSSEEKEKLLTDLHPSVAELVEKGLSQYKLKRNKISDLINCSLFADHRKVINKARSVGGINKNGIWLTKPVAIYEAAAHPDRQKFIDYTNILHSDTSRDVILLHTQYNVERYLKSCRIPSHKEEEIFVIWNAIYFICFKYYSIFLEESPLIPIEIDVKLTFDLLKQIQEKEKELLLHVFKGSVICPNFPEEINGSYPYSDQEISRILVYIKNMKVGETKSIFEIVKLLRHLD